MAIDQQCTHAVRLRHTHHGVVDRAVAMRMIFTETIADDTRTLFVRLIGVTPSSLSVNRILR